jgi:hypothetical protein
VDQPPFGLTSEECNAERERDPQLDGQVGLDSGGQQSVERKILRAQCVGSSHALGTSMCRWTFSILAARQSFFGINRRCFFGADGS